MTIQHITQVVFWAGVFLSLVSIAGIFVAESIFLPLLAASILFNVWSIVKSEREGFVKSRQFRRAHEPARHFHVGQVFTLVLFIMIQVTVSVYALFS